MQRSDPSLLDADTNAQVEGCWCRRARADESAGWIDTDVTYGTVETVGVGCRDESVVDSVGREVDVIGKVCKRNGGLSEATRGGASAVCEFDRATASAAEVTDKQFRGGRNWIGNYGCAVVNFSGSRVRGRNREIDLATGNRFRVRGLVVRVEYCQQRFLQDQRRWLRFGGQYESWFGADVAAN